MYAQQDTDYPSHKDLISATAGRLDLPWKLINNTLNHPAPFPTGVQPDRNVFFTIHADHDYGPSIPPSSITNHYPLTKWLEYSSHSTSTSTSTSTTSITSSNSSKNSMTNTPPLYLNGGSTSKPNYTSTPKFTCPTHSYPKLNNLCNPSCTNTTNTTTTHLCNHQIGCVQSKINPFQHVCAIARVRT